MPTNKYSKNKSPEKIKQIAGLNPSDLEKNYSSRFITKN